MKIHELLKELNACDEAQEWASDKTWQQIYNECHRGDWLCWLFARTNPEDIQLLTLVKGHQAAAIAVAVYFTSAYAAKDEDKNLQETADIFRKFIKITDFNL